MFADLVSSSDFPGGRASCQRELEKQVGEDSFQALEGEQHKAERSSMPQEEAGQIKGKYDQGQGGPEHHAE